MKKSITVILTLVMLLGITAIAPVTADAAMNSTQISLYKNKLRDVLKYPLSYVSLFNKNDIEKCSFTVLDVDDNGVDDLVIKLDSTYIAAQITYYYTVKNGSLVFMGTSGVLCDYYKGGYIKQRASHNQGPGNLVWPYGIAIYNDYSGNFEQIANVYDAEKDHPMANVGNGGYKAYLDYDDDGVIYYVDGEPYTKKEYDSFVNSYIPSKNKKSVSWQKINNTNINNLGKPTAVKLNRGTLSLGVGENYGLVKSFVPNFANQSVTWTSSNSSVATVDKNGKVVGKKSGTANVTVKSANGKTATCKVTVKPAPTSVKTNPTSLKLGAGEKYTISESTSSGSYANAANLRWTSSDTGVAAVAKTAGTNKAVITAKKAGTTNITIKTYNGKSYTCKLTVYPAPASVKLSASNITLSRGKSYTISETTNSGTYANAANLKWSSSNNTFTTVTKAGGNKATIKGINKGTAYIKITLFNGKTAQCKVTVK